jgi:Sap, sulfolipid-1-addressing protein
MSWGDGELLLIALAAMLSPTTLSFSVLALVLGERPLRTGLWFYLGAFSAMLAVGVVAAFVIGNTAASSTSTPKTWVAVVDVIAGALLLVYVARGSDARSTPRRQPA